MLENKMRPVHPGEILRDDVLAPLGMSARAFAEHLGVPSNRVSQILAGERAVTADTALRIARLLGTTAAYWLALQAQYDLKTQQRENGATITRSVKPLPEKTLVAASSDV
ncbi:MAG: HigA family addiction module antitoxin [Vulcanimicrobiaceae bacterium]